MPGSTREWPDRVAAPHAGLLSAVFEGGEGAGKNTQLRLLTDRPRTRRGRRRRHPRAGGTPVGEAVRGVVLDPAHEGDEPPGPSAAVRRGPRRARAPCGAPGPGSRRRGAVRPLPDSSVAYQGVGRGLGVEAIAGLSLWATQGLLPDLTRGSTSTGPWAWPVSTTPTGSRPSSSDFHREVRACGVAPPPSCGPGASPLAGRCSRREVRDRGRGRGAGRGAAGVEGRTEAAP